MVRKDHHLVCGGMGQIDLPNPPFGNWRHEEIASYVKPSCKKVGENLAF